VEELFDLFDGFLKNKGYLAMGQLTMMMTAKRLQGGG
jgi:hypothetical protein